MAGPLLKTKLFIPPVRPNLVPRPRLLERLDAAFRCKLVILSAPPGFGKTTLLSEWVFKAPKSVAWISIDKADNDLARFLTYFVSAIQQIFPAIGSSSLSLLESSQFNPIKVTPEAFFTGLINELVDVPEPFFLILDDYHLIHEPSIHAALLFFLENQPEQAHLIISGRADPPLPLARLRAQFQLCDLRSSDLRFNLVEAGTYLNQAMRLSLLETDIQILENRTEGWIAGLQMAALSIQGSQNTHEFIHAFAGSHHFVADFLLEEVLNHQPRELRQFLLKTSVLERLTPALCDAVLESTHSREILSQIEQANLFLIPIDDERHWYRYHHLFRDLLRNNLESMHSGQSQDLLRRASQWFSGSGFYEEAITHAFEARDFDLAAQMIEGSIFHLHAENKHVAITRWTEALPDEIIRTKPWLCIYRAWGYYWTGEREQVEAWLCSAEEALQTTDPTLHNDVEKLPDDRKHIYGHIAAVRSHSCLTNKDIPGVLKYSRRAMDLLPTGDEMLSESAVALGGAYWALGNPAASEQAFALARSNALNGNHPTLAVAPACYVGLQQTAQGRLRDAMATYREALSWATTLTKKELPIAGFPNIHIGDLLREWNRLEEARQHLDRGVEQCAQLGQADVLAGGYSMLARLQITLGDLHAAARNLESAEQVAHRSKIDPFVQCWMDDCRVRIWIASCDFQAAIQWAQSCGLSEDGELSYHYDLNHINLARVWVAQAARLPGQISTERILNLLQRLSAAAESSGLVHIQIAVLLLQALTYQGVGQTLEAFKPLGKALILAEPNGYVRAFADEGPALQSLLLPYREYAIHQNLPQTAYVSQLLAVLSPGLTDLAGSMIEKNPVETLIEPLTERELEVLRLLPTSLTSTEIAAQLYVAPSTVRTHIKSIYAKLAVNRRVEAVQKGKRLGLL